MELASGDMDGDGDLDLVALHSDSLIVYLNDGESNFREIETVAFRESELPKQIKSQT